MPILDPYHRPINFGFLLTSVSNSNTTNHDDKQVNIFAALLSPLLFFIILYLGIKFCKRYNKAPALDNISYLGGDLRPPLEEAPPVLDSAPPPYSEYTAAVSSPITEEALPTYSEAMELQHINLAALFSNNNASSL